mmetsp:Transcript_81596/g.231255  ORF Transcript_81596/g.231255 Transcript_81596/m.231255 type:complete len:563 (-) Transcript_81596:158-1846(-)
MKISLCAALRWSILAYLVEGKGIWHMVDVPTVVCPASSLASSVVIDTQALNQTADRRPYIFSIYRTSNQAVSLEYSAKDSTGAVIVPKGTIDLPRVGDRRLGTGSQQPPLEQLRRLGNQHGRNAGRRLSSRRRAGGRTMGGGHHKSAMSGSVRRRTAGASSASTRRRTSIQSADGRLYSGPHGHSVGYSNAQSLNGHFPGGHRPTPYGYSGANAYQPSGAGAGSVMMAAAGGAAAGALGMYAFSRWNTYGDSYGANEVCYVGTARYSCPDCYRAYPSERYKCECRECRPKESAARDDLMQASFSLQEFVGPITFTVSSVVGSDFAKSRICPPPGWSRGNMTWNQGVLPGNQDIFVTLTQVDQIINNSTKQGSLWPKFVWPMLQMFFALALVSCCCAGLYLWGQNKAKDDEENYTPGKRNPGSKVAVAGEVDPIMSDKPQTIGQSQRRWMDTGAPKGMSWSDYCSSEDVLIGDDTGYIEGAWGECIAWAKVYELENPDWAKDPKYAVDGPCGQVLAELAAVAGEEAEEAALRLEQACEHAGEWGQPMPLIGYVISADCRNGRF